MVITTKVLSASTLVAALVLNQLTNSRNKQRENKIMTLKKPIDKNSSIYICTIYVYMYIHVMSCQPLGLNNEHFPIWIPIWTF